MRIPFNKPFIAGKELYYIAQSVTGGHLSGDGPYTRLCHSWFEQQLKCRRSLLTHSCTAALEMAAMLCDISPGDEIIMPSFTFVSTANAFVLRGGVPVFVDIRSDTLNIDEKEIEHAITPRTKAIVPVHYAGMGCEMDEIMRIARNHNLYVIEDAAHAILSTYNDHFLGTIGHLGCLSFHETKNILSGEGGALLINDTGFVERAEIIREKGTNRSKFFRGEVDKYTWVDMGSSYLPSELVGAFLYAQLEESEKIISKRRALFDCYQAKLRTLEERELIRLPIVPSHCRSNGHLFYCITASKMERDTMLDYLKKNDIYAVFHYIPLHSSPAGLKYGRTSGDLPVTSRISDTLLRLPLYYEMKMEEIDLITDLIEKFYAR